MPLQHQPLQLHKQHIVRSQSGTVKVQLSSGVDPAEKCDVLMLKYSLLAGTVLHKGIQCLILDER